MNSCLFRLRVSHGWYADAAIPGLALEADAPTLAIMQRYGLWLHSSMSEFALYATHVSEAIVLLDALTHTMDDNPLRFRLAGDHKHIAAVTELPPGLSGLPNFSSRQHRIEEGPEAKSIQLLAQTDRVATHGELLLYPSDLARALPEATWHIHFDPRTLPWVYYIVNHSQFQLEQPVVRHQNGLCLGGPELIHLPDGKSAVRFDSGDVCFPLQQLPQPQFGLYDRIHSPLSEQTTEICLVRNLPTPASGAFEWSSESSKRRVCATVYVYL